jgi:tetratricopeptide (TPR) repeat protein
MPLIEDIQQSIATLNSLGHEPEILARNGETLEPVLIPEEGLPKDLKDLLQSSAVPESGGDSPPAAEADTQDGQTDDAGGDSLDFDSLFPGGLDSSEAASGGPDLDFLKDFPADDSAARDDSSAGGESPSSDETFADTDSLLNGISFDAPASGEEDFPGDGLDIPPEFSLPEDETAGETPGLEGMDMEPKPEAEEDLSGLDGDFGGGASFDETPGGGEKEDLGFDLPSEYSLDDGGIEFSEDDITAAGGNEAPAGGEAAPENETPQDSSFSDEAGGFSNEFSLGDFGVEFGLSGTDIRPPASGDGTEINIPEGASGLAEAAGAGADFRLSEEEFGRLQETLEGLPLNIKVVVEELIGDQKAEENAQINLIRLLVKKAPLRAIAAAAGKLIGRTLVIPKGYEKSSGFAYEAEKGSFAYFFRESILPVAKISVAAVLAAGLLFFLGYRFIYKPIHAHSLLKRGYEMVEEGHYREGNALFAEGYKEWQFKDWYFRYAEKFIGKKQYQLAREKYQELISRYDDYIHSRTGVRTERSKDEYFVRAVLDYANFESVLLENFEEAGKILKRLLDADMYNYGGLLASGDNYVRWAEFDESRFYDKYEEARKSYAILLERYGENPEILFRFLDLFIRTDVKPEVLQLKDYFERNPKIKVDPRRYAELGGYLIDKSESMDEVVPILFRAMQVDENIPDIHYHLARYYDKRDQPRDERLALNNALYLYGAAQPLTRRGLWRFVDTCGRSGELHYRQKAFLEAEGDFKKGIERYEDGLRKTLLKKDATLGRLYVRLGDIYYYQGGELEASLEQFQAAEDSLVADPELYFKKGFIRYVMEDYSEALREFVRTEDSYPSNRNLLFALGNANYIRNNFSIAEGYYSFLTERLEADRRRIINMLPDERVADRAVLLNLIKAYNNLGVILYKLGERTGNTANTSRALVLWTDSSELAENYARDRETLARRDTKNLAYLNLRQILNPLPGYELQIYHQLPRDLGEFFF